MKDPIPEPIQGQIFAFADAIRNARIPFEGLLLAGSFGRGEGVVGARASGAHSVNDIDLVLIVAKPLALLNRLRLRRLTRKAEQELAISHLDVVVLPKSELGRAPLTMFRADLRDGAMVIAGDPKLLELVHPHGGRLPWREAENLLINRLVTLVEGHPEVESSRTLEERARQVAKVLYAVIDAELIRRNSYVTRYAEKRELIGSLGQSDTSLAPLMKEIEWLESAWGCAPLERSELFGRWERVRSLHREVLLQLWRGAGIDEAAALGAWRGKSMGVSWCEKVARRLRGFVSRVDVEKGLLRLVSEAPQRSGDWPRRASELVRRWYRSS